MSGVIEAVDWDESADESYARYRAERDVEARKRLGALWLVRRGGSVSAAAQATGQREPAHAHPLVGAVPTGRPRR